MWQHRYRSALGLAKSNQERLGLHVTTIDPKACITYELYIFFAVNMSSIYYITVNFQQQRQQTIQSPFNFHSTG